MRIALTGLLLGFGVAVPAHGIPVSAEFSFQVASFPGLSVSGAGVASLNASRLQLPEGLLQGSDQTPVPQPLFQMFFMGITSAEGEFAPGAGPGVGFGGSLPASGRFTVIHTIFGSALPEFFFFGLSPVGRSPAPVLGPLTHGGTSGFVNGTGWTTGPVTAQGGLLFASLTAVGFDGRTRGGRGVLQLVTPVVLGVPLLGSIPAIATLTLTLPEPTQLPIWGFAVAALLLQGVRIRRSGPSTASR